MEGSHKLAEKNLLMCFYRTLKMTFVCGKDSSASVKYGSNGRTKILLH